MKRFFTALRGFFFRKAIAMDSPSFDDLGRESIRYQAAEALLSQTTQRMLAFQRALMTIDAACGAVGQHDGTTRKVARIAREALA
jgi:hypothetical protein